MSPPPPPGTISEDPNLTFPLQLSWNQRKNCRRRICPRGVNGTVARVCRSKRGYEDNFEKGSHEGLVCVGKLMACLWSLVRSGAAALHQASGSCLSTVIAYRPVERKQHQQQKKQQQQQNRNNKNQNNNKKHNSTNNNGNSTVVPPAH